MEFEHSILLQSGHQLFKWNHFLPHLWLEREMDWLGKSFYILITILFAKHLLTVCLLLNLC